MGSCLLIFLSFLQSFFFPFFSFFLFFPINMPRSKKGRLSGGARKELNTKRGGDAVLTALKITQEYEIAVQHAKTKRLPVPEPPMNYEGVVFGRVTKILGSAHIKVGIVGNTGMKELHARIPNVLGRRGATPLNTSSVVSVYVGVDFDPSEPIKTTDHFDITSILEHKQAYTLQKSGLIPSWMVQDAEKGAVAETVEAGFEFDYSEAKEDEEDEESSSEDVPGFSRRAAREAVDGADVDIDAI